MVAVETAVALTSVHQVVAALQQSSNQLPSVETALSLVTVLSQQPHSMPPIIYHSKHGVTGVWTVSLA